MIILSFPCFDIWFKFFNYGPPKKNPAWALRYPGRPWYIVLLLYTDGLKKVVLMSYVLIPAIVNKK